MLTYVYRFDDPIAKEYRNSYDNLMDKNLTRNTIIFNQDKETYSVEELVANQLIYAKELCFEFAGEAIKEAVITVI